VAYKIEDMWMAE